MRSLLLTERGSLLLLHMFLVVAVVAAVTVIADVGRVVGVRQELAATADQAAIAGAQAVDLDAYYAGGAAGVAGLPLDPASVAAAVNRYLAPAIEARQHQGLELVAVQVDPGTVTVRLGCRAPLPFASMLGLRDVPVVASASAQLLIQATR